MRCASVRSNRLGGTYVTIPCRYRHQHEPSLIVAGMMQRVDWTEEVGLAQEMKCLTLGNGVHAGTA